MDHLVRNRPFTRELTSQRAPESFSEEYFARDKNEGCLFSLMHIAIF